jgi:hypothetical protein
MRLRGAVAARSPRVLPTCRQSRRRVMFQSSRCAKEPEFAGGHSPVMPPPHVRSLPNRIGPAERRQHITQIDRAPCVSTKKYGRNDNPGAATPWTIGRYRRTGRSMDDPLNVTSCGNSSAKQPTRLETRASSSHFNGCGPWRGFHRTSTWSLDDRVHAKSMTAMRRDGPAVLRKLREGRYAPLTQFADRAR